MLESARNISHPAGNFSGFHFNITCLLNPFCPHGIFAFVLQPEVLERLLLSRCVSISPSITH